MAHIIVADNDLSLVLGERLLECGFEIGYELRHLTLATKGVYKSEYIAVFEPQPRRFLTAGSLFSCPKSEFVGVIDLRDNMDWKVYHFNHSSNKRLAAFLEEFVESRVTVEFQALGMGRTYKVGDYHPLQGFSIDLNGLAGY